MLLWGLQGLAQSPSWPSCVAVMGRWYPKDEARGAVMGFWSTCGNGGNVVATLLSALVLGLMGSTQGAWTLLMVLIAGLVALCALAVWWGLTPEPLPPACAHAVEDRCVGGSRHRSQRHAIASNRTAGPPPHPLMCPSALVDSLLSAFGAPLLAEGAWQPKALSFCGALAIPGVLEVALSYAALKVRRGTHLP